MQVNKVAVLAVVFVVYIISLPNPGFAIGTCKESYLSGMRTPGQPAAYATSDGLPGYGKHPKPYACAVGWGLTLASAKADALRRCRQAAANNNISNNCKVVAAH